jgi:tetratricopeptide (TPR) repeat protein
VRELEDFPIPYWLALALTFIGETLRLQGRLDEAAGFVERGIQNATRVGYAYAMGFAHRIAGRIARDRGLVLEASSQLRQALEIFERASAVFEAARTRLDLAEVAAQRGDRTEARGELTAAARTFQSLGATAYGDRTTRLAASLGLSVDT